jgi:hypothetical protein
MKNIKTYDQLNEGTMISKRNASLEEFKSQASFFNREPHSNDSPAHTITMAELNEDRQNDMKREIQNVIMRYKTKMATEQIYNVLKDLAHEARYKKH